MTDEGYEDAAAAHEAVVLSDFTNASSSEETPVRNADSQTHFAPSARALPRSGFSLRLASSSRRASADWLRVATCNQERLSLRVNGWSGCSFARRPKKHLRAPRLLSCQALPTLLSRLPRARRFLPCRALSASVRSMRTQLAVRNLERFLYTSHRESWLLLFRFSHSQSQLARRLGSPLHFGWPMRRKGSSVARLSVRRHSRSPRAHIK